MRRLNVGIDSALAAEHGPEILWIWRTLLTAMGFAWREVAPADPDCDVAYVADPVRSAAKLTIRADVASWRAPEARRLVGIGTAGPLTGPRFDGEAANEPLVRRDGRLVCERDLPFGAFWLATGQSEPSTPKSRHGFFDLGGSPFVTQGVLREALASASACGLAGLLTELGCGKPRPRWPHGNVAAACASHDVDYPQAVRWFEPMRVIARQGIRGVPAAIALAAGRRHHWHFASWLAIEESLGVRSAFYFVATQGSLGARILGTPDTFYDIAQPKFRRLFAELKARGAEIGLHATYRACETPDGIAVEKQLLEEAAGVEVVGNRHHYWRLNPGDPGETLRYHERAGLVYDSSLLHDRYVGWRRGFSWPFHPFDRQQRRPLRTLQIPPAWMDDQLFRLGAYNPGTPAAVIDELIAKTVALQGCLALDVHEYVFDQALYPGWAAAYRYALEQLAGRRDVWLATPAQVARHWIERAHALEAESIGLDDPAATAEGALVHELQR